MSKHFILLTIIFTSITIAPSFSQFRDFRKAVIIKSNGDSLAGKVNYKLRLTKEKEIFFKDSNSKQRIPISELRKIIFTGGETYSTILLNDSIRGKVLSKNLLDGEISLYGANGSYYIGRDSVILKLDDGLINVGRGPTRDRVRSKKYLVTLNKVFIDCPALDYQPLAKGLRQKPLMNLTTQYAECKNISIKNTTLKPSIEFSLSVGPVFSELNSDFIPKESYRSNEGMSYSLSFLMDVGSSSRFKVRLDVNYYKYKINGSFTQMTPDVFSYFEEYVSYSTKRNGIRIPIGLQYHFFNNTSSFYLAGGISIDMGVNGTLYNQGHKVFIENDKPTFEPTFNETSEISITRFTGIWCAGGGDICLTRKLKINAEVRGVRTESKDFITAFYEFIPSLGLKYKIR